MRDGAGLDPVDLCLFLCFPNIGVLLRPDGVFLPGVLLPFVSSMMFSSEWATLRLSAVERASSSGSGESSLINLSTEGVSAPSGR